MQDDISKNPLVMRSADPVNAVTVPFMTACQAVEGIASGKLHSVDLVAQCQSRIERHNPRLNALVTLNLPAASHLARNADLRASRGEPLPPLHGLPITIKDSFETRGLRTTSSYPPLANYVPERDATAVARLKAAGGIILGKSNLPELAGAPHCWSPLFGPTRNPWNPELTPGGSSGGSAVAIAAGLSFLELGSDIGGSIRIPAAYCGVAGFKATENRIPRTGHIPHLPQRLGGSGRSVRHMLSFGVLGRSVSDLQLGFPLIAGPDGEDSEVPPVPCHRQPALPMVAKPLRIAWWDDFAGTPLCRRSRTGLAQTLAKLRDAGHMVTRGLPEGFDIETAWQCFGILGGAEIGLGMPNLHRRLFLAARHLFPRSFTITRAIADGLKFDLRKYNRALNQREDLICRLEAFLDQWDVLICPVASTVAYPIRPMSNLSKPPAIQVDEYSLPYLEATISMTIPFSLTGSPVVVLPAGIQDGLPVGLQVIGKRWRDETLLAHCARLEPVFGGYVPPPQYS